jgi:hypothetical protein
MKVFCPTIGIILSGATVFFNLQVKNQDFQAANEERKINPSGKLRGKPRRS